MNRIDSITKPLIGFVAILLTVLAAGCGGSSSPILGGRCRSSDASQSVGYCAGRCGRHSAYQCSDHCDFHQEHGSGNDYGSRNLYGDWTRYYFGPRYCDLPCR